MLPRLFQARLRHASLSSLGFLKRRIKSPASKKGGFQKAMVARRFRSLCMVGVGECALGPEAALMS